MKKTLTTLLIILFILPLYSLGFDATLSLNAGVTECLGGSQVQKNQNLWDDASNLFDYINAGGLITTDIIFSENMSVETGFGFNKYNLHYTTQEEKVYGNGVIKLNCSIFQIPVLFKYTIPLKKTTETVNGINIAGGINLSYLFPNQTYTDDYTTFIGNFINPSFNVGFTLKATYSAKIGPGKVILGLKSDINFLQQKYAISGQEVNIGNVLSVSPMIGYTFTIKEDKSLSKITEKNKRIKDIDVR